MTISRTNIGKHTTKKRPKNKHAGTVSTEICSQCGVDEAMADYHGIPDNWLEKAENGPSESP